MVGIRNGARPIRRILGAMASPLMGPPFLGLGAHPVASDDVVSPTPGDAHMRSYVEIVGYRIHATDGEIGHVENFILDDTDWTIRYLIVDTSNWWLGKHVLIAPVAIASVHWFDRHIHLDVTRDKVETEPALESVGRLRSNLRQETSSSLRLARLASLTGPLNFKLDLSVAIETGYCRLVHHPFGHLHSFVSDVKRACPHGRGEGDTRRRLVRDDHPGAIMETRMMQFRRRQPEGISAPETRGNIWIYLGKAEAHSRRSRARERADGLIGVHHPRIGSAIRGLVHTDLHQGRRR